LVVGEAEDRQLAGGHRLGGGGGAPGAPGAGGAGLVDQVADTLEGLSQERRAIRGLFAGGTLCYEAMVVITKRLGAVHSNVPLREEWSLPAPEGAHLCLDMGEEEYTRGRAHPMIDPELRVERIREESKEDGVAVILLDVVLGYGAMEDPAAALAPACAEAVERGVRVVAYVLGTEDDPQGLQDQRRTMAEAGCLLAPTGARSALMASAIADGEPEVAGEAP
jgi:FdrA protein